MHCIRCTCWRHRCDYKVVRWDYTRTRPRKLSGLCHTCLRDRDDDQQRVRDEAARVRGSLCSMSREDRFSFQLEGGIQVSGGWSLATEDYDPTPLPQGCHSCYLTGGPPCVTCPDEGATSKMRAARTVGLCPTT